MNLNSSCCFVFKYLGTSTILHGIWYWPGPGAEDFLFGSLFPVPNPYDGEALIHFVLGFSYWPGPGTNFLVVLSLCIFSSVPILLD